MSKARRVWLMAAGKAALMMADAAVQSLGDRLQGGLVVSPGGLPGSPLEGVVGQHPQPGPGSEEGGRRALALAQAVPANGELLVLISGGASSLLALPADGVTLADKRETTAVLLRSGADIYALNTVRKHLSKVKGGRLAAACPAVCRAFVLSDVVGDDLGFIASGPTVADRSTYADALRVVEEFGGRAAYPAAIVAHLAAGARGDRPESPKPGDPRLARAETVLVGGRHDAMRGAAVEAARLGYHVQVVHEPLVGEARTSGPRFASQALAGAGALRRPACIVASGETTVKVVGNGVGGRNQEMALAVAPLLSDLPGLVAFGSLGTDGIDGPTDAAGAIVDGTTSARAAALGFSVEAVLDDNNAYACLDAIGDLVRTGPSGTNVGDLQIFLLA